jgi:GDPmannose 4,6-dehydratase
MKKVIITGVSGQDGSYMVEYLLANTDYQIFGMVRRSAKPDYSNIKSSIENPRFKLVMGDLSDSNSIENLIREIQPDYFINFAGQSFVGASWQIAEQTFDVTATGVLRILESIRKHAPQCRFYSAGSSEEMGDVVSVPQTIDHPIRPRSPYGAAKAAARHVTKVYRESYNLYAVHCILYNHESERRGDEFVTRKISKNVARIKYALDNKVNFGPLELGNIDSKRDWSHASDFIDAIWRALNQDIYRSDMVKWLKECKDSTNLVYNPECSNILNKNLKEYVISSGEMHSIREFVEKAFAVAGIKGQWYITNDDPKSERYVLINDDGTTDGKSLMTINPKFYRPAEVQELLGDSSEARGELNWKPKYSFDDLVKVMVLNDISQFSH